MAKVEDCIDYIVSRRRRAPADEFVLATLFFAQLIHKQKKHTVLFGTPLVRIGDVFEIEGIVDLLATDGDYEDLVAVELGTLDSAIKVVKALGGDAYERALNMRPFVDAEHEGPLRF